MLSFDEEDTSTGFNAVTSDDNDMDRKIHEVFKVEYLSSFGNNAYTPADDALEYDIVDEREIRLCDVLKNLGIRYHCCHAVIDCDKLVQYGWDKKYVFIFGSEEWVFQGVDEWITGMSSWIFAGRPENVLKAIPVVRKKCSTKSYSFSLNMMGIIKFDCRNRNDVSFDCREIMATADIINQEINPEGTTCITKIIDDFKVYVDTNNFTANIENPLTFDGNKVKFINDKSCEVTVNLKYDRSSGGYAHGLGSFGIFFDGGMMKDNRLFVNIDATTDNQYDHIYILAVSRACLYSLTSNIPINYLSDRMTIKGASFCRSINPRTISKQINLGETKPKEVMVNIPVK